MLIRLAVVLFNDDLVALSCLQEVDEAIRLYPCLNEGEVSTALSPILS